MNYGSNWPMYSGNMWSMHHGYNYGKRSAEAEPAADADAYYGPYSGYNWNMNRNWNMNNMNYMNNWSMYSGNMWNRYGMQQGYNYGKRSADAEPKAEAAAEPKAEAEAKPKTVHLTVDVLYSDLEAVEAPSLGHLNFLHKSLDEVFVDDTVRSCEECQDVLDKILLLILQPVPIFQILAKVNLFSSPERSHGLFVHLPD